MGVHRKSGGLRKLVLGCVFFMTVCSTEGFSTCHISEIEGCLSHVEPFMRKSESIFPSYDDHTLGDVCKSFKLMEDCLAPVKPACSHTERQVYEGIEKANNFLCGSGLQQYRNYRVCFANAALTKDGNTCNFTYSKEMEKMRSNNKEPLEKRAKKLCKDTDNFMKCVKKAVLRHCGNDAASWVHNINIKVFSPLLDGIGCHEHRRSSRNNVPIAIILGVALAVIAILTSVVITSLLCRRRQRQLASNSHNKHTSVEEDKKQTKTDMFSQVSDRKANIYSTSPKKKVAAVNGNIRKVTVDESSDSEKLLNKDGSVKGEQVMLEQLKDGVDGSGTYEQILGRSPEKMAQEDCCESAEHQEAGGEQELESVTGEVEVLTVWPLPATPTKDNDSKVTTPVKTPTPTRPTRPAPPPPSAAAARAAPPAPLKAPPAPLKAPPAPLVAPPAPLVAPPAPRAAPPAPLVAPPAPLKAPPAPLKAPPAPLVAPPAPLVAPPAPLVAPPAPLVAPPAPLAAPPAPAAASHHPMVAPSTINIENERPLLPSGGEHWKQDPHQHESDLDSEGFPPPPPPICIDDLQNDNIDDQRGQGQVKVNFVAPFGGMAHYSSKVAAADPIDDLDQTEVKRAVPRVRSPLKHRSAPAGCRDSSLYEEEVDRLLEKGVPERGGAAPKRQLDSLV